MPATRTSGLMPSTRTLGWYAKRLRVMQPSEVWARLGSQCELTLLSVRHRLGLNLALQDQYDFRGYGFCSAQEPQLPTWYASEQEIDDGMTARVLTGGLPREEWSWRWSSDPDVWHQAPDTGRLWPKRFFGYIQYRDGNPHGDVRYVWEPARLQQLVLLGLIAACGSEDTRDRAVRLLEAQFLSWVEANPLHTGVHYISAMECGLRLIAVCHAFDSVRAYLGRPEQVWPRLLQLIDGHAMLIQQRLSLHSSLGNHTIAEGAALVYAGILFPEMPQASQRESTGLLLLKSEISHQILPDGGGTEQAFWYLRFIRDLYDLVTNLLSSQRRTVPDSILQALNQTDA